MKIIEKKFKSTWFSSIFEFILEVIFLEFFFWNFFPVKKISGIWHFMPATPFLKSCVRPWLSIYILRFASLITILELPYEPVCSSVGRLDG